MKYVELRGLGKPTSRVNYQGGKPMFSQKKEARGKKPGPWDQLGGLVLGGGSVTVLCRGR